MIISTYYGFWGSSSIESALAAVGVTWANSNCSVMINWNKNFLQNLPEYDKYYPAQTSFYLIVYLGALCYGLLHR